MKVEISFLFSLYNSPIFLFYCSYHDASDASQYSR